MLSGSYILVVGMCCLCCPLPLCIHGNSCLVGQLLAIEQYQNQFLMMIIAMHICQFLFLLVESRCDSVVSFLWLLVGSMTSYSIYAVSASFFQVVVIITVLLTMYHMVNRTILILHSWISSFEVENFYDAEDISIVF